MRRRALTLAISGAALLAGACAFGAGATGALAYSERSVGTPEQVAWVRRAAGNFIAAELAHNGAGACGILNAPLRASQHGRSCEQRWDAKLARLLAEPGERARLRALHHAAASARVVVHGNVASIELAEPLAAAGANRFLWTENCWMLMG
jgi:hypothetical protein